MLMLYFNTYVLLCVFVGFLTIFKVQLLPHNVNAICGGHAELRNVKVDGAYSRWCIQ